MTNKPLLPPINSLLKEGGLRSHSEPCSPFFIPGKLNSFKTDDQGVIKLPPLLNAQQLQTPAHNPFTNNSDFTTSSRPTSALSSVTPRTNLKRARSCSGAIEMSPLSLKSNTANIPETPNVSFKKQAARRSQSSLMTPTSSTKAQQNENKKAFAFISHSQDTFPSKEPSIDNAPLARRKRRRTSKHELNILQAEFEMCATPDKQKRVELSRRCNMSEKAIQIWFQNKRQSVKRQQKVTFTTTPTVQAEKTKVFNDQTPLSAQSRRSSHKGSDADTPPPPMLDTSRTIVETVTTKGAMSTPTKQPLTQQGTRGQALTFRLKSDTKVLTPIKTSPNNRVNKLINGGLKSSPSIENISPTRKGKAYRAFTGNNTGHVLKEINVNTM